MKKVLLSLSLLCLIGSAHGQAYKCTQADGSLAFQDHPCSAGAAGSKVDLPEAQSYAPGSLGHMGTSDAAEQQREANQQIQASNARVDAENRQNRCNAARQRLGVLKEQRPIYQRDDQGNRVYMEDKDRPAAIAQAEQSVAANCK